MGSLCEHGDSLGSAACEKTVGLRVRGQVQGVGFRPFVWQLARDLGLRGTVSNDAEGVWIAVAGPDHRIADLVAGLSERAPPLARVSSVEEQAYQGPDLGEGFAIAKSTGGKAATGVVPDAATCPSCIAELTEPGDRRYGYAFGNCTHCGPRFSIIRSVPYDRASTSMADFEMCSDCDAEYRNPADRRFHAQPIACPKCGPSVWLDGGDPEAEDPIVEAARLLEQGKIVAIKGLGGFHLACLAADENAVDELRRRKRRDAKPFAVMMPSVKAAQRFCQISAQMAEALESSAAPIVLCPLTKAGRNLPETLAPDHDHLGIMLPYTPLHHLLMTLVDVPLVMTSGNLSDEPQVTQNDQASHRLGAIADAWLFHNRDIVNRIDDSVLAFDREGPVVLRRARGYAPDPIRLETAFASDGSILAMGGELKATFCLLRGGEAVLSQHIGDLEDAASMEDYRRILDLFIALYDFTPTAIAVDSHPDYLSSQWGRALAHERGLPLIEVPHHHAHFASCLAENGVDPHERCVGLVCDGLGHGADGSLWGGEVLVGDCARSRRIAALPAIALPGGAAAIKQPWRNLVAHLHEAFGADWRNAVPSLTHHLPAAKSVRVIEQLVEKGLNAPRCSSAGRLFDAVAAALGVHCQSLSYEGQAAMALEAMARANEGDKGEYAFGYCTDDHGVARADLTPMWQEIASDIEKGAQPGAIAARFHRTLAALLCAPLTKDRIGTLSTVALSGGVLQNRVLRVDLCARLRRMGLRPLVHRFIPASDGGLALGQAVTASCLGSA